MGQNRRRVVQNFNGFSIFFCLLLLKKYSLCASKMSYGDRNNKLSRFASSSSIASTVSSASSASSVPTTVKVVKRANPGSFSKRIYESKEEDLSEYVDSAYRNIIAYQYCLLANKEAKLKAKQEELRDSQQRLQAQFAHYSQIQEQNVKKRNALRELQLLKSAIGTGNEIKQFSESVEFLCRDSIPLMISNEEFDQLRGLYSICTHSDSYFFLRLYQKVHRQIRQQCGV